MPTKQTSQWEFDGLFEGVGSEEKEPDQPCEAPPSPKVWTVEALTRQIRQLLESRFRTVRVSGEVSNLRWQSSGHCYFSLKDAGAQLSCVLFRGEKVSFRDQISQGVRLILSGDVSVYMPRGQYQMIVRGIELDGIGSLQMAFERLKAKLQEEGLFDASRKRALCRYPETIGLVTSVSGAALRDVMHVLRRRHPGLKVLLADCRVQGQGASSDIARSIDRLNRWHASQPSGKGLDMILLTRGGGSLEDLWAFNEEGVARAIASSTVPMISAIGHEIDFTISDFVADVRAATPSAAAEMISEGAVSARQRMLDLGQRMRVWLESAHDQAGERLYQLARRLDQRHPRRVLESHWQQLDEWEADLSLSVTHALERRDERVMALANMLRALHPVKRVQTREQQLQHVSTQWQRWIRQHCFQLDERLKNLGNSLHLLGPRETLARGYSITTDAETGQVLSHLYQLKKGMTLSTMLSDGSFESKTSSGNQGP